MEAILYEVHFVHAHYHIVSSDGFLPFLRFGETTDVDLQVVMRGDDATSPPIVVPGGIPFGNLVHNDIYVSL